MAHRHAKTWTALGCAAILMLGACSDDASGGGGGTNNHLGPNNGSDATADGSSTDGANADATSTDADQDTSGQDASDQNNGTCQPSTTFFEVYQPNVYLLVDRSQSMDGEPMTQAKAGLDAIADELAGRIRLGVGAYPFPSAGCGVNDMVAIGANAPADLKDAWASLTAAGGTPTGQAIFEVGDRDLLSETGDTNDEKRQKALVVITDGDPTVCEDEHPYIAEAEAMAATGTPIFVVGFHSQANPDKLEALAVAGGTDAPGADRFYTAASTADLAEAVRNISTNVIGCTHTLDSAPESAGLISVALDGQPIPQGAQDGFSYDPGTAELTINGSYCNTLQDASSDGTVLAVTVNCPGCTVAGNTCSVADQCCSGTCVDGTCGTLCQPLGGSCYDSADCCGETTCTSGDEALIGTCVGG